MKNDIHEKEQTIDNLKQLNDHWNQTIINHDINEQKKQALVYDDSKILQKDLLDKQKAETKEQEYYCSSLSCLTTLTIVIYSIILFFVVILLLLCLCQCIRQRKKCCIREQTNDEEHVPFTSYSIP